MSDSELERNLGLLGTIAIAMGSMIGSGIFILPGVAFLQLESVSVALTFLVGGILTIPAALSAAELGTAIPESGGSYLYIERGMGPLLGTIAGIGNWLVLNFKTALALIGGIPYLIYVYPQIRSLSLPFVEPIIVISVGLTILFTVINAVSAESAGKAQNYIVAFMLVALGLLLVGSTPEAVNAGVPSGLFDVAKLGFVGTTALVFVSYAGVIKVTSVAEEIKNPGRNIPLGIIISLIVTTIIYVAITYVTVVSLDIPTLVAEPGTVPAPDALAPDGKGAIIAILAQETIGRLGAVAVVAAAILALASTANSGILSASRYPLSMARDSLAPSQFQEINDNTGTPVYAILLTGLFVIVAVFLPIDRVARLGGAFQIIVFILVNLALIGFREGDLDDYRPEYTAPLYPYLQLFGILSGIVLLSQLSLVAIVGSMGVVGLSIAYYYGYVRDNLDREGQIAEEIRGDVQEELLDESVARLSDANRRRVMVVVSDAMSDDRQDGMIQTARALQSRTDEVVIDVVNISERIKSSLDESHPTVEPEPTDQEASYENISYTRITTQEPKDAIVEYAAYNGIDLIMHGYKPGGGRFSVVDDDINWIVENAPCETLLVDAEKLQTLDKIAVVSDGVLDNPLKLVIADALCESWDAHLEFTHIVQSDAQRESLDEYVDVLRGELVATSSYNTITSPKNAGEIAARVADADMILSELDISTLSQRFRQNTTVELVESLDKPFALVYSEHELAYNTLSRRLIMKYIFRGLN